MLLNRIGMVPHNGIRDLIFSHLPKAVVASAVITLFNILTRESTTPIRLFADFTLHAVAIFVGFVIFAVVWNNVLDETG